ncbi:MAG: hypothetical protein ACYS26_18105 [Planctomycetota bacterium]|jgi:hypothetical protein
MSDPQSAPGFSEAIPIVVQIGLAGARHIAPSSLESAEAARKYEQQLGTELEAILRKLPDQLGLNAQHFICVHSQAAIGVDAIGIEATARLGWLHRVALPRLPEEYVNAQDPDSSDPDFTAGQAQDCLESLQSEHVIEVDVVSKATARNERFEEVNQHLARICDVIVCVVRADRHSSGAGGSKDLIDRAQQRGRPLLVVAVSEDEAGAPTTESEWTNLDLFQVPTGPREFDALDPATARTCAVGSSAEELRACLASASEHLAEQHQKRFRSTVRFVLVTHVLATALATAALLLGKVAGPIVLIGVLAFELAALGWGYKRHSDLHHKHEVEVWAMARLVREVVRSAQAVSGMQMALRHFFQLPMPQSLRPLLRTLNVMHLAEVRRGKAERPLVSDYVEGRIRDQWNFYDEKAGHAESQVDRLDRLFRWFSMAALLMTSAKLLMTLAKAVGQKQLYWAEGSDACGFIAIVAPVAAVAALTWATSNDYRGRAKVFREMQQHLGPYLDPKQIPSSTGTELFHGFVLETESRLLGETANWYARRAFLD